MEFILMAALVLVASGVGTMTGFGTSTIMVPVLVPILGLPTTLLFVGIIHWFGNVWKIILFRQALRWRLILLFAATGVPTTILASWLVPQAPEAILSRVLAVLLIAYVAFIFYKPEFELTTRPRTTLIGGAVYGLGAGIFGIGGAIRSAFLSAYNLPKEVFIATAGAIGFAIDTARVSIYLSATTLPDWLGWGMLVFVPISLLGAKLAQRIVHHLPQTRFRQMVAIFLFLIGIYLLISP